MSELWVDTFKNETGKGAPDFPNGITVTGVITATTLNQTLNGDLTVTGKVSIGGTLTYEDVTNIDAVGIITARDGIRVGTGGTVGPVGAGIVTYYGDGSQLTGISPGVNTSFVSTQGLTVVGVTTFQGDTYMAGNPKKMYLNKSGSDEISIWSSGGYGYITHAWGTSYQFQINTNGEIKFGSATAPWKTNAIIKNNSYCKLYNANEERLVTSAYGIEVHENQGSPNDGARIDMQNVAGNAWASIHNDGASGTSELEFWTLPSGGSITERLRIGSAGQFGIGGANYGTSGQVLKSGGASAAPSWGAADGWAEHVYFNKDGDSANVSTNTWAKVAWDAGYHRGTSTGQFSDANDRYTPGTAGWYLITAGVCCHHTNAGSWWHIEIRKNGTGYGVGHSHYPKTENGLRYNLHCTGLFDMDSTDYVEVFINQSTGTTRGIDDKALTVVRVGTNS